MEADDQSVSFPGRQDPPNARGLVVELLFPEGGVKGVKLRRGRARRILLTVGVLAAIASVTLYSELRALDMDRSQLGPLSFDEEFNAPLSLWSEAEPDGRWKTNYATGDQSGLDSRRLRPAEQQVYVDDSLGVDPFSVENGALTITADRTPTDLRGKFWFQPYTSGLLTTEKSFSQLYGYFEMRARLPYGHGLWPAFWLLPTDGAWPQEIDVVEAIGDEGKSVVHVTEHHGEPGEHEKMSFPVFVKNYTDYNTYAVLWRPDAIFWYINGRQVAETPTPPELHRPMYMLVNLGVGGDWPGDPDASTSFPAKMQIDWIRAYPLSSLSANSAPDPIGAESAPISPPAGNSTAND
jgi:beta-glucanase (GH16 family)